MNSCSVAEQTTCPMLKKIEKTNLCRVKICCPPACCYILLHAFHKRCYDFVSHDNSEIPSSNTLSITLSKLKFYDITRITCSKVNHWERLNYWDIIKCFNVKLPQATISFEGNLQFNFTFQHLSVSSQVHTGLFAAHPEAV